MQNIFTTYIHQFSLRFSYQPIRLSTNFMTLIPSLAFTDYEWFPWNICNGCGMPAGNAYPSGHLVPSHIVGLACAPFVETRFLELAISLLDFSPRIPLASFSILLDKFHSNRRQLLSLGFYVYFWTIVYNGVYIPLYSCFYLAIVPVTWFCLATSEFDSEQGTGYTSSMYNLTVSCEFQLGWKHQSSLPPENLFPRHKQFPWQPHKWTVCYLKLDLCDKYNLQIN